MPDAAIQAQPIPPFIIPSEIENRAWTRALKAAALLTSGDSRHWSGIIVDAQPGPVRDAWLSHLTASIQNHRPIRRLPINTPLARLDGGIDLEATVASGKTVRETGIFDDARNGFLVIAMAERLPASLVGRLAQMMDAQNGPTLILLNEAEPKEDGVAHALADRCAMRIDLRAVTIHDAAFTPELAFESDHVSRVIVADELLSAASEICADSVRKTIAVTGVTRALAAMENVSSADTDHLLAAVELILGVELQPPSPAEDMIEPEQSAPEEPETQTDNQDDDSNETPIDLQALQELLVSAAEAVAPDEALQITNGGAKTSRKSAVGKAGANRKNAKRGRPVGFSQRPAFDGQRPDAVATLRTAAPWQRVRARTRGVDQWSAGQPLRITKSDLRYKRLEHPTETTVIFAVDASGSTALERLGEAKGCIEILLGRCYVRRDQVALVAFRGERAEVLLEPTRSLVRAKKSLASLPGGGPTPLADAIRQSHAMAHRAQSRGQQPLLVFLTDGRGNIAINGEPDRAAAKDEAMRAARLCAGDSFQSLIIDIARRPRPAASQLAQALAADYCTLPRADAETMSELVGRYMDQEG
ncbi:MAG: VWA domain-containing protein [Pseudomonadota bacterium]